MVVAILEATEVGQNVFEAAGVHNINLKSAFMDEEVEPAEEHQTPNNKAKSG